MKYLYGAAVQGIQQFIFQTNTLAEIIGASELVEDVCTSLFDKVRGGGDLVVSAAGNVKCIFENKEDCEKVVRIFPKMVMEYAPGITISQAVVKFAADDEFQEAVNKLEKKLRQQRNMPCPSLEPGLIGITRSNQTGGAVIDGKNFEDASTAAKMNAVQKANLALFKKAGISFYEQMFDISSMTDKNDWVAIIHVDGNGLGQVVQKECKTPKQSTAFSTKLNDATCTSALQAIDCIWVKKNLGEKIPIRPIVLNGDDFTVICRGDIAMDLVKIYMERFEENTKDLTAGGLKACAGIAFIKSSFPFYFGYQLAEELCRAAKKDAKGGIEEQSKAPSCLMFHKVEDSFIQKYEDIEKRVLLLDSKEGTTFKYGPYYLHAKDERWTIDKLMETAAKLNDSKQANAVKSHIRQWVTLMKEGNKGSAKQLLDRLRVISYSEWTLINSLVSMMENRIPAYDVLSIHSINVEINN